MALYVLASEAEVAEPVKSIGVPAINLKFGFLLRMISTWALVNFAPATTPNVLIPIAAIASKLFKDALLRLSSVSVKPELKD